MYKGSTWNKRLTMAQTWWTCLAIMGLHILPLILADYPYIDDLWRAEKAGNAWAEQGRVLNDWLYAGLGFSSGAPDLFPLPLLLATAITAGLMALLIRHYFTAPGFTAVLVVLPLWLNPFFLQSLSYQYDGPATALAMSSCILAVVLGVERWGRCIAGMLLATLALSFYQLSINVFAGLCCIEVMRKVFDGGSLSSVCRLMFRRLSQLVGGSLLYYLSAFQLITSARTAMLPLDAQWPVRMLERARSIAEHIGLLVTPGTVWFWGALLALCMLALFKALIDVSRLEVSSGEKLGLALILVLCVLGVTLLVYGMMFFFAFFDDGARMLMGFGPMLVMCAMLAHRLLERGDPRLPWLLAIPCIFMLSFSFAYGRVLLVQKDMHRSLTLSLVQTITHQPELMRALHIYIVEPRPLSREQWLPAAEGSFKAMPALRYVLNINYMLTADLLPRYGLTQVRGAKITREELLAMSPNALLVSTFFDIHLSGGDAYVWVKVPRDGESRRW